MLQGISPLIGMHMVVFGGKMAGINYDHTSTVCDLEQ